MKLFQEQNEAARNWKAIIATVPNNESIQNMTRAGLAYTVFGRAGEPLLATSQL